ncbi:MAG: sugar transferase [Leptospiraceae bacterium]|nr:sugar transferase [Leptospiraceae bacterium]
MFDFLIAGVLLLTLWPMLLLISLLIRLALGTPVLFRQLRPGLREEPFTLIKLRTMAHALDRNGQPLPDEKRLGRLGRFLRATSLDELPELWNVLKGEMSLVGPRPLLMEYLELYDDRQRKRHLARPGITGWAQVNGRNAVDWAERFEMDVWYVENWSFLLDLKILFMTLGKVFRAEGVNAPGQATMHKFQGNRPGP